MPPEPQLTLTQEITCGASPIQGKLHASYAWSSGEGDSQLVSARTIEYLAQKDRGETSLAYDQFSEEMKADSPFDTWHKSVDDFNNKVGKVKSRKVVKVSWVKDPPGVDRGFCAAADYAGKLEQVDYECGCVAWYRDALGHLAIVRQQQGYIDRRIQETLSFDELRKTLAKIGCIGDLPSGPLPEMKNSDFGYRSVAEALSSLRLLKDVKITTVRDWTIITDEAHRTVWSFAPQSYPAYPSAV